MGVVQNPNNSTTFGNSLLLRVDGAIGAMSLSPNGRDAVLAGRRGLFIIDLDDPFTPPRWLHHITSWEVADVQWSPHHTIKPSWCISTSNQKALLWDLARPSNNAILNVLHYHTRAITDINFHPSNPEVLATSSIDTFILSWDMRAPRKPVAQWAEWRAGTTQVKWNHENPFEIASSHDNGFHIWDSRKTALPVLKVNSAHNGKINGLDFSEGSKNIITCSNDNTVKFWNLKSEAGQKVIEDFNYFGSKNQTSGLQPSVVINTNFPVARARSLPFGKDKACGIMPLRGGLNAVHIVNYDTAFQEALDTGKTQYMGENAIHTFKGHNGPIKDFLWRKKHEKYEGFDSKNSWKDYQLVTWSSQDYDLKLWPHDENLYKNVNYNPSYDKLLSVFNGEALDTDEAKSLPLEDSDTEAKDLPTYSYQTYCMEPPVTVDDLTIRNNGDELSALTLFQIAEKHKQNIYNTNQLNHLDWISGVRMGRAGHDSQRKDSSNSFDEEDGPSNLGEEVSIVGHKFPKVRFEKISVSTGELVVSLRGPIPNIETSVPDKVATTDIIDDANSTINEKDSTKDLEKKPSISNTNEITETPTTTTNQATLKTPTTEDTQEQKLVFIRTVINFPTGYPFLEEVSSELPILNKKLAKLQRQNVVFFEIEETHELPAELIDEMTKKLNEISNFYSNKYKQYCLEPCLRFLMGDKIDLNDELMIESRADKSDENIEGSDPYIEIGNEGWADDLISQQPEFNHDQMNDNSSGEEDVEYTDLIPANNNEDLIQSTDSIAKTPIQDESTDNNASAKMTYFDSTPIPKGCGAVWSPTGQLVCFFIPKNTEEEENKTLQKFNIFKFTDGGFSLNTHNNHHHHNHQKIEIESDVSSDNSNSDGSDVDSTTSSSDDSFINDWDEILQDGAPSRARIPGLFKTSVGLGNRYMGQGNEKSINRFTSHGGTASNYKSSNLGEASQKKKKDAKNKNIVGIFDFSHLLPDKYELACEYRVLGDSPEKLAHYNSEIAMKYGLKEICDVWRILEMILIKDVQVDEIQPYYGRNENLLDQNKKRRDPKNLFDNFQLSRNAEAVNQLLHSSELSKRLGLQHSYRFYWGTHPFGHTWLIKEIFKYFELKGNIQMLAMLSCILYENSTNIKKNSNDLFNIPINTPYRVLPPAPSVIAMRKLTDNHEFHESFSTDKFQDYLNSSNRNSTITGRRDTQQNLVYPPQSPMSQNHFSQNHHFSQVSQMSQNSQAHASHLFNNPMNIPLSHLVSIPYAKSISSSFDLSMKGSSPERFSYLKKNIQPTNTFMNESTDFRDYKMTAKQKLRAKTDIKKIKIQPPPHRRNGHNKLRPPPVVQIEMMNTKELDLFHDEYSSSLLNSQDLDKIRSYRDQYAEMLFVWGLPINRIKILKFNYPELDEKDVLNYESPFNVHSVKFGLRNKTQQYSTQIYVSAVTSIATAKTNSWNTMKRVCLKYCVLCNLLVSKNLVVCMNCEHILHTDCASEWWSTANGENLECPSGCGCKCMEHTV